MSNLSAFDTLGPVMVGPSSSHTAGAVRIGNLAREIVGQDFKKIKIYLHGSFKETYQGHGTDKALIGGLLGLSTESSQIKKSFQLAKQQKIDFEFIPTDLGEAHPNTVKLEIKDIDGDTNVITASSIGGGNIVVTEIDGVEVDLTGDYPTLITLHKDKPGVIAQISTVLNEYKLNIAEMKVVRQDKGALATAVIGLDQQLDTSILNKIRKKSEIKKVKRVNPIE
ncbi:L-serine ammonia-lyase, iron-sulfur-dependent subunit beta [Sporohalobacter salinus]|uniref:L-serine ammonia-lyase, iron-sulfur-dependent subunit beta n=1 Tax=Sporohalobacter salinus TaxID=1494606 RepID=UPI00196096ED|nr:L-serine ammonia-lyase, iron-sulfur-dependent subunit beta [Sporohalobacter salinus]MBM7624873.1 L-serine dehydratase [Sporohalobacter salinus]